MSAELQSAMIPQQNDCVTLAILTAVGYDYLLTFSNEIKYLWSKPWTWVSTLFILVRYAGLCSAITMSLFGSSFLPGPEKTCGIIYIIARWTLVLFLGAADFVMILRVWAMYARSRLILSTLLILFLLEMISAIVAVAFYSDSRNPSAVTIRILDFSFCAVQPAPLIWPKVALIIQITHGGAMCFLAIVQFVRESLQMYRVTKQWQLNRYMNLLVRQGIFYFFAVFLFALIDLLSTLGYLATEGWPLAVRCTMPMYTLTPRFIMSIRELYAQDGQGRRGGGIDTGFGLSLPGHDEVGTAIVFADVEQNEGSVDIEEIPVELGRLSQSR